MQHNANGAAVTSRQVMKHVPALARYARSLTARDPEDLVQATIEKALALSRQGPPLRNVEAYLVSVMRNLHVDRIRAERAAPQRDPGFAAALPGHAPPRHDLDLVLEQALAAVDSLPPGQRALLRMAALEGLSYREIALRTGLPIGTVTSRLSRARAALADKLEWDGDWADLADR